MTTTPRSRFHGSWVALPTPFRNGAIDFPALRGLIERQIAGKSAGLVAAGSTGEAVALTACERLAVIEFSVGTAGRRLPVLAGVGASETGLACELAQAAQSTGAVGILATTPAYNRPQQRGLERHFGKLAECAQVPIVLYNIPSRTGVDLLPTTVAAIVHASRNVVAIKEAGTTLERVRELVELDALDVLAGEDAWIADALQIGAVGVIGVVANLAPAQVAELVEKLLSGERSRAPGIVEKLSPLVRALFLESNPAPLKAALSLLGLCREELRLPLVPVEEETRAALRKALAQAGIER